MSKGLCPATGVRYTQSTLAPTFLDRTGTFRRHCRGNHLWPHRIGVGTAASRLWHRLLHCDLGRLVGPRGKITAIEIVTALAERARAALAPWPQITVSNADGAPMSFNPTDLIFASAGATHPLLSWLDALRLGGRLLCPITATNGSGSMLLVPRQAEVAFASLSLPSGVHRLHGRAESGNQPAACSRVRPGSGCVGPIAATRST